MLYALILLCRHLQNIFSYLTSSEMSPWGNHDGVVGKINSSVFKRSLPSAVCKWLNELGTGQEWIAWGYLGEAGGAAP